MRLGEEATRRLLVSVLWVLKVSVPTPRAAGCVWGGGDPPPTRQCPLGAEGVCPHPQGSGVRLGEEATRRLLVSVLWVLKVSVPTPRAAGCIWGGGNPPPTRQHPLGAEGVSPPPGQRGASGGGGDPPPTRQRPLGAEGVCPHPQGSGVRLGEEATRRLLVSVLWVQKVCPHPQGSGVRLGEEATRRLLVSVLWVLKVSVPTPRAAGCVWGRRRPAAYSSASSGC